MAAGFGTMLLVALSDAGLRDPPVASSGAAVYLDGSGWTATSHAPQGSRNMSIQATVPGDLITDLQQVQPRRRLPTPAFGSELTARVRGRRRPAS